MITPEMCLQLRAVLAETRGHRITQTELAREFGLTTMTIARYESKNWKPKNGRGTPIMYVCAMLYKIDEAHLRRHTVIPHKFATQAPIPPRLRAALERAGDPWPEMVPRPPEPHPETIAPSPVPGDGPPSQAPPLAEVAAAEIPKPKKKPRKRTKAPLRTTAPAPTPPRKKPRSTPRPEPKPRRRQARASRKRGAAR